MTPRTVILAGIVTGIALACTHSVPVPHCKQGSVPFQIKGTNKLGCFNPKGKQVPAYFGDDTFEPTEPSPTPTK